MRSPIRALLLATLVAGAACASLPLIGPPQIERWAFTAPWDARSFTSANARANSLDGLVIDWIALESVSGLPTVPFVDSLSRAMSPRLKKLAMVTSFTADAFQPALIRRLARDPAMLERTTTALVERVQRGGSRGMVLDFEGMTPADTSLTRFVVTTIADAAHARGIAPVVVAIPPSDTAGYPARIFASADLLLVMLYDQHWATSSPGAIAAPDWVRRTLAVRVAESGASRIVAALPLYGYQWTTKGGARAISYADAVRLAAEAGVALERDPASSTLHASRPGSDGWELWVSDATLLNALQREVAALNVRRVAYWRLGMEDPAFW